MAKAGVNFTKDNEYYTPSFLVNYFKDRFGEFDYDPATVADKATEFGIRSYNTKEDDGLLADWAKYKRIWINPPFTIKHLFFQKALETYKRVKNDIFILFPIEFVTTSRFGNSGATGKLFIPNGRIKFESGLGKKSQSPAFGSTVYKFQDINDFEILDLKELEKHNEKN